MFELTPEIAGWIMAGSLVLGVFAFCGLVLAEIRGDDWFHDEERFRK